MWSLVGRPASKTRPSPILLQRSLGVRNAAISVPMFIKRSISNNAVLWAVIIWDPPVWHKRGSGRCRHGMQCAAQLGRSSWSAFRAPGPWWVRTADGSNKDWLVHCLNLKKKKKKKKKLNVKEINTWGFGAWGSCVARPMMRLQDRGLIRSIPVSSIWWRGG